MVLSKCDALRDLHPRSSDWKIKVRVFAKWSGKPISPTEPGGVHFIFIDDGRTRIHAFIGPEVIKDFSTNLAEGRAYEVTNFSVNKLTGSLGTAVVRNPLNIYFESNTVAVERDVPESVIPKRQFDIYSFAVVEKVASDRSCYIDLIGVVYNILPIHRFNNKSNGDPQCWVVFYLNNGRDSLKIKLWDEVCEKFMEAIQLNTVVPVIAALSSLKPTTWQGELTISSSSATRFSVNGEEYIFDMFRTKIGDTFSLPQIAEPIQQVEQVSICMRETVKASEMKQVLKDNPNESVTCILKLKSLDVNKKWLMLVCTKCQQHLSKEGGAWFCLHCKKKIPIPDKRYLLFATASDMSGTVTVVFLDREVHAMTGKGVYDLDCIDEYDDDDIENEKFIIPLPTELKNLEEKTFEITLSTYQEQNGITGPIYMAKSVSIVSQSDSTKTDSEENTLSQKHTETSLTTETETTPSIGKNSTTSTLNSTNKRKLKKKQTAVPFEMEENIPLTHIKIPKKERVIWEKKNVINSMTEYRYAKDESIPFFKLVLLSCLGTDDIEPEKLVKCVGCIIKVEQEELWYEQVCPNCHQQTKFLASFYNCTRCDIKFETALRRFKVVVYIDDPDYTLGVILPHNVITKLCKLLDQELLTDSVCNAGIFPAQFLDMVGQTKLWLLRTKIENLEGNSFYWTCYDCEEIS